MANHLIWWFSFSSHQRFLNRFLVRKNCPQKSVHGVLRFLAEISSLRKMESSNAKFFFLFTLLTAMLRDINTVNFWLQKYQQKWKRTCTVSCDAWYSRNFQKQLIHKECIVVYVHLPCSFWTEQHFHRKNVMNVT